MKISDIEALGPGNEINLTIKRFDGFCLKCLAGGGGFIEANYAKRKCLGYLLNIIGKFPEFHEFWVLFLNY